MNFFPMTSCLHFTNIKFFWTFSQYEPDSFRSNVQMVIETYFYAHEFFSYTKVLKRALILKFFY